MQPLPTEVNPRVAFERLFGDGTSPEERPLGTQAERQHSRFGDAASLVSSRSRLGAGDQARLDTYLENIREIERRIKIAMEKSMKEPIGGNPVRPAGEASTSTTV